MADLLDSIDTKLHLVVQSAVLLRENFSSQQYEVMYDALKDGCGGFTGVAQLIGDAAIVHEEHIPDQGESFDWIESMESYASQIYFFVESQGYWPTDEDLESMTLSSVEEHAYPDNSISCPACHKGFGGIGEPETDWHKSDANNDSICQSCHDKLPKLGKHTPGPWYTGTGWVGHGEDFPKNGMSICSIDGYPHGNSEANLVLIASAPELLNALERIVEESESDIFADGDEPSQDAFWAAHSDAAMVIKKAKGE